MAPDRARRRSGCGGQWTDVDQQLCGLHQAARTGMGIVLLPDALVEQDLKDGKLVALMPDYLPPSRPMNLMYAQDRYRLPKLRSFVDFALQMWGKH